MTTQQKSLWPWLVPELWGAYVQPQRPAWALYTAVTQDALRSGKQQDQTTRHVFKARTENRDGTSHPLFPIHHLLLAWFVSSRSTHTTEAPPRSPHLRQLLSSSPPPALRPVPPRAPSASSRRSGAAPSALPRTAASRSLRRRRSGAAGKAEPGSGVKKNRQEKAQTFAEL